MTQETTVLLGLGANLGDRQNTLEAAWSSLSGIDGIHPLRMSRLYDTAPFGGPSDQPRYLNAAALIRTSLDPAGLLERTREIEQQFGRVRLQRWGPRTLDIDLLLFGLRIVDLPQLSIPHPEMLRRRFVLEPAVEIAPEMTHPITGRTLAWHWAALEEADQT